MPAFYPPAGQSRSAPSTVGEARKFYDTGSAQASNRGSVYQPTASGSGSGVEGDVPQPGVISINPLDPLGTAEAASDPISGLFNGLKNNLFGTSLPDAAGHHGGLIGDVPGVGDVARAGSEAVAGAGGQFFKGLHDLPGAAADVIGGTLERIPLAPGTKDTALEERYNDPSVQAWLDEPSQTVGEDGQPLTNRAALGEGDTGIAGTGILSNALHAKESILKAYDEAQQVKHPTLFANKFQPPHTLAEEVGGWFDVLGAGATVVERGFAGFDKANGMNQLDMVKAVGNGQMAWDTFSPENTDVEQLAYEKTKSGEWTDSEALDWLASHGAGYSHDVRLQIAAGVGLDPLNLATFGAGAVAKVGAKGAVILSRVEGAAKELEAARTALKAAEEANVTAQATKGTTGAAARLLRREAKAALDKANGEVKRLTDSVESLKTYQSGTNIRKTNVLARKVEGRESVQELFKIIGKQYEGLEGTALGRASKLTRTIIDPLHAIDLHMPGNARKVDLLSDSLTKTLAVTVGEHHYTGLLDDFAKEDATGTAFDMLAKDWSRGMTNRGREGLMVMHQTGAVVNGLGGALAKESDELAREGVITAAAAATKEKDLLKWLRYDVTANILQRDWSTVAHSDLAKQLESIYHFRSAEEWMKLLPDMSIEKKSLLKLATYGNSNKRLLDGVAASAGHASAAEFKLNRLVLISKKRLTRVGGESMLSQLKKLKTRKAQLRLIREKQELYPELRFISIDEANPAKSIQKMIDYLDGHLDAMPMQLKAEEIKKLHPDLQDLAKTTGDGYSLGFRPDDEFLWGIERTNAKGGEYAITHVPWADHVADGGSGFRPGRKLPLNIAGNPVVGRPAKLAVGIIDHIEAGARGVNAQVSGAQIAEVARQRFVSEASRGKFAEHGLTESVAQKWWDRIHDFTMEHQGYSGPRGFGKTDLYNAIGKEGLIPQTMLNGSMRLSENDVLEMILRAYDGDIRFIGLTQKLSARAKVVLSQATGFSSNFTGQIAEHAWPTVKFRYNPIFQLQEKIEPWVLNAQRGVSFATGVEMSKADIATERLLQKLTDNSIIRQADLDQAEYSAQVLFGRLMKSASTTPGTRIQKMQGMAQSIMDVQGVKRINMLRTFRQGLGKELKSAWDEAHPGVWDDMKLHADIREGRVLDEDEFALQVMGEQMFSNDILVKRLGSGVGSKSMYADWSNAIKPGAWHVPAHIGELQALDLDHVAKGMRLVGTDGKSIEDLAGLRKYMAEKPERISEVTEFLNRMGAHKDYIKRVENSLKFSWEGFWREAKSRYSLTQRESIALQDMIGGAANIRGMNPVDYMSQVFNPGILDGTEGLIGSLDAPLAVLRKAGGKGRSRLAGVKGESTGEDFVRQLSAVFSQHLDPSAKRALLMEFQPELRASVMSGDVQLTLKELDAMWDSQAENALADRILGYMSGKPPEAPVTVIKDEARGIKSIRDGADRYLAKNGVTPGGPRHYVEADAAHYEQTAKEYSGLPEVDYEVTGRRPMTKQVYAADTDLKPQPADVDDRTYKAYQQFVHETKAQWDHMTTPKASGGMGIKVTVAKGDPYTADAAGRAAMKADLAKGKLRVKGTDSDHPLMTNEQSTMFRAVHDAFGHAANDFSFGPRGELNAAASHFKMYGTDARGPLLTETHGQTAYVNYSDDLYEPKVYEGLPEIDPNDPVASFEAAHPFHVPEGQAQEQAQYQSFFDDPDVPQEEKDFIRGQIDAGTGTVEVGNVGGVDRYLDYTTKVGPGIRALPKDQQHAILQALSDTMAQFPDSPVHHVDTGRFGKALIPGKKPGQIEQYGVAAAPDAVAITIGGDSGEAVIILNEKYLGVGFEEQQIAFEYANRQWSQGKIKFVQEAVIDPKTGQQALSEYGNPMWKMVPRKGASTAPFTAGDGIEATMRHEFGHALDLRLRPRNRFNSKTLQWENVRLPEHAAYFDAVEALSNSAGRKWLSEYGMTNVDEFAAELFSAATDPALVLPTDIKLRGLRENIETYQKVLIDNGYWKPSVGMHPEELEKAGKTIRELNSAKRGTVYAPQKAGLLPQSTIDEFGRLFVGQGKHVESNPDVARVAQQFGKFSENAITNGLLRGDNAIHGQIIEDIAGIPTHSAAPYNLTEGLASQMASQNMARKWADAYRLQYFAQDRSMLERSINHPMFGLYPASYMWGKIMPEVVQFIAQRPLGIKTGGGLYTAMDMQAQVALQREFNPEFDALIEKMGHSQAMSFIGYLLPTIPWDISASAPSWMKDVAGQGLRNEQAAQNGGTVEDFNAIQPMADTVKKLNPLETTIPWAGRAIDELNGPNTPTEQRQQLVEQAGAARGPAEVGSELAAIQAELQAVLSGR